MAAIAVPYLEIFTGRTPPSHSRWSTTEGVAPDFVSMMTRSGQATSVPSVRSERHVSFVSTVARPCPPGMSRVLRSYDPARTGSSAGTRWPYPVFSTLPATHVRRSPARGAPASSQEIGIRFLTVTPRGPRVLTSRNDAPDER